MNRLINNRTLAIVTFLLAPVFITAVPSAAFADFLYASDLDGPQIYKVDQSTGALLQTIPVKEGQDTLVFNNQGNIIYSAYFAGQIRMVNPAVGISSDTLVATVGGRPVDLALTPDGNSVLATNQITGQIDKIDLTHPGSTPTAFGNGQYTGGIAFDTSGRLFAVSNNQIVQLNPTNLTTVIASSGPLTGLDGLAFDPFTGKLFAASRTVNGVSGREGFYELSLSPGSFLQANLITSSSFPTTFDVDGLEPDGKGHLYLADEGRDQKIYQYDLTTGQLTALSGALPGLDDLAPLAGAGAPPTTTPEPASLTLLIVGAVGTLGYAWRRRKQTA